MTKTTSKPTECFNFSETTEVKKLHGKGFSDTFRGQQNYHCIRLPRVLRSPEQRSRSHSCTSVTTGCRNLKEV